MEIHPDFRELLELFNEQKVDFIIVGGYALAFLGAPRATGDMDILVRPDRENGGRIVKVLDRFGFSELGLVSEDFTKPDVVIQLGRPPGRVDLLTSISGVSWEDAFTNRVPANYGGVPVAFLGRSQFILNKRATGRAKDLADLEALGDK